MTAVDVPTGAAVAASNNDVVRAVVPLSLTKDKDVCVGASVAFEGTCVGAFAGDAGKSAVVKGSGGGSLIPWGTRTVVAPVNCCCHCRCRCCRHLRRHGGRGRGWQGRPPSVVVFIDVGGGSAVPDPAAECAPLKVAPSHPNCSAVPVRYITIIVLPSVPPPLPSVAASRPC